MILRELMGFRSILMGLSGTYEFRDFIGLDDLCVCVTYRFRGFLDLGLWVTYDQLWVSVTHGFGRVGR